MPNAINGPFIVTGASGQFGSQVIETLLTRGAEPIVSLTPDALLAAMIENGLPEFMADVFSPFDVAIAEGYLDVATNDLENLTEQKPQSVRDLLLANKPTLTNQG